MTRVALKLDTLNISPDGEVQPTATPAPGPSYDRLMSSLPTPRDRPQTPDPARSLRTSVGKRTHDFFSSTSSVVSPPSSIGSPRPRTASNVSANSNDGDMSVTTEPLSRLPSARAPKGHPPRQRQDYRATPNFASPSPRPSTSSSQLSSLASSSSSPPRPLFDSPQTSPATTPSVASRPFPRIPSPEPPNSVPASSSSSPASPARGKSQPIKPGLVLEGRFRIQSIVGSGSFSKVVRASRIGDESGPSIAIKMIHKASTQHNERMRLAVQRETEVLKHIRHPSLVRLFESFETPDHECLVLEYVPGGELFDLLVNHHHNFTEAFVRRVFCGLLDVVKWMHSICLVHRDIKLENVLLTTNPLPLPPSTDDLPNPLIKLSDFGLSRFIDPAAPMLRTRCGSEEYAAPELITGKDYDGRKTDAWALGVVLFTLLTGSMPFLWGETTFSPRASTGSSSRRAYLMRIAKAEYHWPSEEQEADLPFHVPSSAKRLVAKLLAREPAKRATLEDIWLHDEWLNGGPGKIETRDWLGHKDDIWFREQDQHPLLRTEVHV